VRNRVVLVLGVIVLAVCDQAIEYPSTAGLARVASFQITPRDSEELKRLHDDDQADRVPKAINWGVVTPRDRARATRVKEFLATGGIHTPNDYYNAALILQHGETPEDFLLAHEFCVVAMMLGKNDIESSSLAAAAEDRFLMNIGRPQRFGTQFRSEGSGPLRLYPVRGGVTDELRRLMAVPSLAEAKAQEAELNRK